MRPPLSPFRFDDLSFGTPMMLRLKCAPLGAPLPVASADSPDSEGVAPGAVAEVARPMRARTASVANVVTAPNCVRVACMWRASLVCSATRPAWRTLGDQSSARGSLVALRPRLSPGLPLSYARGRVPSGGAIMPRKRVLRWTEATADSAVRGVAQITFGWLRPRP